MLSVAAIALALFVLFRPHGAKAPAPLPVVRATAAPPIAAVAAPKHTQPWSPGDRTEVRSQIENALDGAISGAGAVSLIAIAHDGTILYSNAADRAVTPASVQKLIVADAALSELGPQYRFDTLFASSQSPGNNAIDGDLWLVTSGDPSLQSKDLRAGIAALRGAGVSSVQGSLVVDPSALAGEEINPLWNADDANEDFMAATSGASIDEDTVEFRVQGTQYGEPAGVHLVPSTAPVTYDGTVTTGGGDDVTVGGTNEPNTFHLSGSIPPGALERFWVPVHGIPQYLASVTSGLLRKNGIGVAHAPRTGTVPLDAVVLWNHRSAPLQQLVKHMLFESDN
ncbi:MAG TPA: D-alanyl-D-alanine carboxypeptidase/D-alanyl-D-alanine-endopeptidase, partial [Candidatus Baltobacteraceae bacterium]|nr:D-alanyl-D-alanine carboxypeptidase/D-alanyl-D-alanine-endopeptidase [Candidatus Baltobacteraceae bacterium]